MSDKELAKKILELVGGTENVVSVLCDKTSYCSS